MVCLASDLEGRVRTEAAPDLSWYIRAQYIALFGDNELFETPAQTFAQLGQLMPRDDQGRVMDDHPDTKAIRAYIQYVRDHAIDA